jgi:hypothetical protein
MLISIHNNICILRYSVKVYITRDEGDDWIWLWKKPPKGNWAPKKLSNCDTVLWQREDGSLEGADAYSAKDFKKKFGIMIKQKTKRCVHLPDNVANSEDYKLFSSNGKRKK